MREIAELWTMKILITAATEGEMNFLRKELPVNGMNNVQLAVTGVGLLATMFNLMKLIKEDNPDILIQFGIAGTFNNSAPIGTAVAVKSDCVAEMGVWENETYADIFDMGLTAANTPPFDGKRITNPHLNLFKAAGLPEAVAVSVNRISTNPREIALYKDHYEAEIESMEGAALHFAGVSLQIPFLQIRGISNLVGERNKTNWKINEAMHAAIASCKSMLNQLNLQK